ncbi:MAG: hypothetical protein ABFS28_08180 [Bacteroidota bacterium]
MSEMDIQLFLNQSTGGSNLPGHKYLRELISPNLAALKNVVVVAHRGWGKTILLRDIGFQITEEYQDIRVLYFDLEAIYDKNTFIRKFIQKLYRTFSAKVPDHLNLREPDISMMSLTETLASRRKVKLILFISNFQQIDRFKNSRQVLSKLNYCWRMQKNCAYCISGHNRHFFKTHFRGPGKPFPSFAKVYYQYKNISRSHISYVKGLFFNAGKTIERDAAAYISLVTDNHLHFLQVLCWHAYMRTDHTCTRSIAEAAFKCMALESEPYTTHFLEQLTEKQFNYLRALLNDTQRICSRESLEKYDLGRSANVARIKKNLEKKGILEVNREFTVIIDPFLRYRLEQYL